jgi:hypothetical protein
MDLKPYQWRLLRRSYPAGYTDADAARDLAKLATRAEIQAPVVVLAAALNQGAPVYSQSEVAAALAHRDEAQRTRTADEWCPQNGQLQALVRA